MTLVSGHIVEISVDGGIRYAKVSVGGALIRTPLLYVPDVSVGDWVLLDAGVAIAKIDEKRTKNDRSDS